MCSYSRHPGNNSCREDLLYEALCPDCRVRQRSPCGPELTGKEPAMARMSKYQEVGYDKAGTEQLIQQPDVGKALLAFGVHTDQD